MPLHNDLRSYYAQRAQEYDQIYLKPERQPDLAHLRLVLPELLSGLDILELACGTGYWTQPIARTAHSLLATDINEEVLALARNRDDLAHNVSFQPLDALRLEGLEGRFTGGFAGFWWSHVPHQVLPKFLHRFHDLLDRGSRVVFVDNRYVPGSSTPITREDEAGNTYQRRTLAHGTHHEVLKNFPSENQVRSLLTGLATEILFCRLDYYWYVSYRTTS